MHVALFPFEQPTLQPPQLVWMLQAPPHWLFGLGLPLQWHGCGNPPGHSAVCPSRHVTLALPPAEDKLADGQVAPTRKRGTIVACGDADNKAARITAILDMTTPFQLLFTCLTSTG
jgi:hypothetical protein